VQRESYVHGNSGPPLIGKTIGALLDEVSATDGSREALVVAHQKIRWTYAELKSRSDAFASGLLDLGLEPGDRVGIWSPNCAEWTIAQFATAKAGLILVNINPAYRLSELEHVLQAVGCRALITAARFKSSDYVAMIRELVPELGSANGELHSARLPELRHVISLAGKHDGCLSFDWILERGKLAGTDRLESVSATIQIDDAVNIQFTSGTTGLPKGATLSHHNLINNAFFVGEADRDRAWFARVYPGAAIPLLWHGDGQSWLRHPRSNDGLSIRVLRSAEHPGSRRGRALRRALRGTHDVHRPTEPP
jgi:fatty-acyl-CoA synthase